MVHNRINQWFLQHLRALKLACIEFIHTPFTNVLTICVIGMAITFPLCLFIALENLQYADSNWEISTPSISLYLKTSTQKADVDALTKSLQTNPAIEKITYITPEEGLAEFEKNTPFTGTIKLFQHNPIPGILVVYPNEKNHTPDAINNLFTTLKQLPFVDLAQLDMNWVTRLYDIIQVGQKVTKALSLLFAFGIVLTVGHTLRAQLAHNLKEIRVLRLIGATNAFIRRPLLYRGVLYGLLGGVVAWVAIASFLTELQSPVSQLAQSYQSVFQLESLSLPQGIILLIVASLLGLTGAWIITAQFLNMPEQVD
ncbi:MAG: permease-like cell division protein FtsX [Coxiellaceae bacterium]|nr:permease-like cell division protein FtsX [Coxiellaceae bacterium]